VQGIRGHEASKLCLERSGGHGLEAVYAMLGSWADHERAGKIKAPSSPPITGARPTGGEGGEEGVEDGRGG